MKYCNHCNREFGTQENKCPVCGAELQKEKSTENENTAEIVSLMTMMGIL